MANEEIYVYVTKFPKGSTVRESILPCAGGYTLYLNANLTREQMEEEFRHAQAHVRRRDFEKDDVQKIEMEAHVEG